MKEKERNEQSMIRLFEEQVQKYGEKAAICDPVSSQTVTYGELEENSRSIILHEIGQFSN